MVKLKMIFGLALATAVLALVAFAPSDDMGRFVLPDGCCESRVAPDGCTCNACGIDHCGKIFIDREDAIAN